MIYHEVPPPQRLAGLVSRFWFLRGSAAELTPQTIVPDGRPEIVVHLGEPFGERDPSNVTRTQSAALFAGQLIGPLHLVPLGEADVVGIRFHPAAARSLLRIPASELTARVVPL